MDRYIFVAFLVFIAFILSLPLNKSSATIINDDELKKEEGQNNKKLAEPQGEGAAKQTKEIQKEHEEDVFGEDIEGTIGDPARWDTLSKKVIPEIIKKNEDLGSMMRKVSRARCVIDAKVTSRLTNTTSSGKLTLSFNDENNDGVLTGDEVEVDVEDSGGFESADAIKNFKSDLKIFMLCNIYNLFQIHHVKTKEVEAGYLMTLKPILDASQGNWVPHKYWEMKVTKDYKIIESKARFKDDAKAVIRPKYKEVGGKWVCVGYVMEATADTVKLVSDAAYTFDIKKGMPFLNKIEMENALTSIGNAFGTYQVYSFTDWKVKEREKSLGIPKPAN